MRPFILFAAIFLLNRSVFPQWAHEFTSQQFPYEVYSGWINFQKTGDTCENRMYYMDTYTFNVMSDVYPGTVQYTYTLTAQEILAGYYLYSLWEDVTGDDIVDFYVMSVWGESTNYRYSFKIFDVITGQTVFEKNDPSFSYSYPTIWDVDGDGILECTFSKCTYPSCTHYFQEVYSTGYSTSADNITSPGKFELKQNYPNPFNPSTSINFFVENPGNVKIEVYDIRGSLIRTLLDTDMESGSHSIIWDGLTDSGIKSASGVYFYNLKSGEFTETKKMIVLK
ncbi:MAG: T9SS C-terminal target domain-containing protein [Ignavibacteriales bacterium]|nr:MAG: T9SS C-terminal target domain-containing protein [Ignavibacteriales bacterium]